MAETLPRFVARERAWFAGFNMPADEKKVCLLLGTRPGFCGVDGCDRYADWRMVFNFSDAGYVDRYGTPMWFCDDHAPSTDDPELVVWKRIGVGVAP